MLVFLGFSVLTGAHASDLFGTGVAFNIRYFDKRIYYLEEDPILVQITLTNNSPYPFRFRLADERAFSIDFDVRTNSNRAVEAADILIRRRSRTQQVYFRDVTIETGESFSFVEDLRDYAALTQSGSYVVQARIYPDLYQAIESVSGISPGRTLGGTGRPLESNRLTLSIRPRVIRGHDGVPVELDVETNAVLVREKLPPDEVVTYLLTARQKSQWEKFFLYLDLEAMLSRDGVRRRQWLAESEEGRQRMLVRYKQDLQNAVIDGDISLIPMDFQIERTIYDTHTATVSALQFFRVGNYTERKRYTWYLERKDDVWNIVDYLVINLGTQ
jgi:hypothetical protein